MPLHCSLLFELKLCMLNTIIFNLNHPIMKTMIRLLLCFSPFFAFGQVTEATLLGHWDDETLVESVFANPYHDVWGAVVNGREVGILTSTAGFHFFDLSDDASPFEPTAFAPGADHGASIAHRDIKTYLHYAYAVADEGGSALQVIDMSNLPESVEIVYESNEFIRTCHNIFIDEDNARLYAVGGATFDVLILSLANPEDPQLLATYPNANLNIPYIHDLYVRDNIAYLNGGGDGLFVVDFADPLMPEVLGTLPTYVNQGYNHSGWLSADEQYYYLGDETHGADVKVLDVSDLSDIEVIARTNAGSTPNQIAHNFYLQGDLLYMSYYYDGLQVFDVSDPRFPRRIAAYDTHDGPNTNFFAGAWGIFVLPSGRVLISDMNIGLFYFEAIPLQDNYSLTANMNQAELCIGAESTFSVLIGDDFEAVSLLLSFPDLPANVDISVDNPNPLPGDVVEISITPQVEGQLEVAVMASDGVNEGQTSFFLLVNGPPVAANLNVPQNGKVDAPLSPVFLWGGVGAGISKTLEISTDSLDFESNIIIDITTLSNALLLQEELEQNTQYFWRIITSDACGDAISEVFTFTTRMVTNVREIEGNTFTLFPNPASDQIRLEFEQPLEEDLQIEWYNTSGQKLKTALMNNGDTRLQLAVNDFPAGVYFLKMATEQTAVMRRVVVE